jgi:Helix-turn-helix domain
MSILQFIPTVSARQPMAEHQDDPRSSLSPRLGLPCLAIGKSVEDPPTLPLPGGAAPAKLGYRILSDVLLARKDISSPAIRVLLVLQRFGRDGRPCFVGNETLAQHSGLSVSTVKRVLVELVGLGLIAIATHDPRTPRGRRIVKIWMDDPALHPFPIQPADLEGQVDPLGDPRASGDGLEGQVDPRPRGSTWTSDLEGQVDPQGIVFRNFQEDLKPFNVDGNDLARAGREDREPPATSIEPLTIPVPIEGPQPTEAPPMTQACGHPDLDWQEGRELYQRYKDGRGVIFEIAPDDGEMIRPRLLSESATLPGPEEVAELKRCKPQLLAYLRSPSGPPGTATAATRSTTGVPSGARGKLARAVPLPEQKRVRDLIAQLAGHADPTIEATVGRAIAGAFGDHKPESLKLFLGLAGEVRRGELAEACLQEAFEVACGKTIRNRGAMFTVGVKQWMAGRRGPASQPVVEARS